MESLIFPLSIIFVAILGMPGLSKILKIPVIVLELLFGILIGASFFNILPNHPLISFFASFGLIYLMFLAGLEINFKKIEKYFKQTFLIALLSLSFPFLCGYFLANFSQINPLILGTIFSTTSLGLILPAYRELEYKHDFKEKLLISVVLVDLLSMFILAFAFSLAKNQTTASVFYSLLIVLVLFFIPYLLSKTDLESKIMSLFQSKSQFGIGVRLSFALIFILTAIVGELGVHSIVGAFIAGLIISEINPKTSILKKKLEGFGYGFFIPLFFIFTGARVNVPLLLSNTTEIYFLFIVIITAILSKVIGAGLALKLYGFSFREALSFGFFHSARLSLIIALADIGLQSGLISLNMFSIFVLLAAFSAVIGPILGKALLPSFSPKKPTLFYRLPE